jgi:hypothetical protein
MKMNDFPIIGIVDTSDLYLTRDEYRRAIKKLRRGIGLCKGCIFALFVFVGILAEVVNEKQNTKDETAG